MDVESFEEGILGAIVIQEGEVASVGAPIAFIAETDADLEAAKAKAGGESRRSPSVLSFLPSHVQRSLFYLVSIDSSDLLFPL